MQKQRGQGVGAFLPPTPPCQCLAFGSPRVEVTIRYEALAPASLQFGLYMHPAAKMGRVSDDLPKSGGQHPQPLTSSAIGIAAISHSVSGRSTFNSGPTVGSAAHYPPTPRSEAEITKRRDDHAKNHMTVEQHADTKAIHEAFLIPLYTRSAVLEERDPDISGLPGCVLPSTGLAHPPEIYCYPVP